MAKEALVRQVTKAALVAEKVAEVSRRSAGAAVKV